MFCDAQRLVERRAEMTIADATALAARPLELKLGTGQRLLCEASLLT